MADPVKLDDDSLERLAKILNSNRGGGSSSAPNMSGVGESANLLRSSSSNTGKALDELSGKLKLGANEATGIVDTFKTFTNFGVNFSNDSLAFRGSIAQTRMSVEEYKGVMKELIPNITALGGTVTDGTKRFNQMSKEFGDTTAADQLRQIGFTTKDYNEVLAISLAGRKNIDFQDAQSRQKANMAAADLALEMDKVAQLTGVSRQDQQRTLQEKQGNARVQAAIEQQVRAGGADAAAAYQKMAVQMKGLGLDKLSDEIYSGQALSQKSIAQLNALGPAGNQLRDAINQVRNATDAESRARADAALREAQAAVARQVTSDQSLNQIRYGQGETAEALGEISISARNYANGINEEKERARRAGREISDQEAAQNLEKRARFAQDLASGRAQKEAEDALTEAKKSGKEADIAAAQAKLREVQQAKAEAKPTEALIQVLNRLNDTMASFTVTAVGAAKGVAGSPQGQAFLDNANKKLANQVGGVSSLDRGGLLDIPNKKSIDEAIASGNWKLAGERIAEGFMGMVKGWWDTAANTAKDMKAAGNRPGYAEGTAGAEFDVSKLVKDFGTKTTVDLHGKEAVVTEDQLKKLVSGVMSGSMVSTRPTESSTGTSAGGATGEDGMSALDRIQERLKDRLSKVTELQQLATERQLTEQEKDDLRIAENGVRRAQNNLKAELERQAETDKSVQAAKEESKTKEIEITKSSTAEVAEAKKEAEVDAAKTLLTAKEEIFDEFKGLDQAIAKQNVIAKEPPKPKGFDDKIAALQKELAAKGADIKVDGLMGPLTRAAMMSKSIPAEIKQARVEEAKKTAPPAPKEETVKTNTDIKQSTTLDDLKEQLIQLNKTMGEMLSHSSDMVGNIEKQVRATKRLDPNVSLRG